ncbi:hypothetical protein BS47DRAFT_1357269 [Hydnum rufescens UP504]|uniref:Uncharacterized protein n=1 Tax=Hydnum rufescens UP504 TaxID=1448309 RepID=A0A9P6BAS6_9AGAM|nr:hypothetical protein BS47DRAFT_1357269 [Hydnum rufescens UP504]
MPSRIVFERATPPHPSMPPSTPPNKGRKSRRLSRFLRKLGIVSRPTIPTPASIPVWTETGTTLSPCTSSRPSLVSSSSRCPSSRASSSGNRIHHAFGLALHSTSTLSSSQSGSEYNLSKAKLDFNSLLPHLQSTENDNSITSGENNGPAYEYPLSPTSFTKRARLSLPEASVPSTLRARHQTLALPPGPVLHPLITVETPIPPVQALVPSQTYTIDHQTSFTPGNHLPLGPSNRPLDARIVEEDADDLNDLDNTLIIDCSITFPTNWVERFLQTDFPGVGIEQINQPAVEFGPFPLPCWSPGGSVAIFIVFLALYMQIP